MFHFARKRALVVRVGTDRHRPRPPITIGFEELEGREMLSTGMALTIIPTETRPLMSMPRPYVGSMDPESRPIVTMLRREDWKTTRPSKSWPLGGRFRAGGP